MIAIPVCSFSLALVLCENSKIQDVQNSERIGIPQLYQLLNIPHLAVWDTPL